MATQICYIFFPIWGDGPIWLYNIFQLGWFNHQLDKQQPFQPFVFATPWRGEGTLMGKLSLLMVQTSGDHQLRLVVYPIIYRVLYIPGGWPWDFWTINSMTANLPMNWASPKRTWKFPLIGDQNWWSEKDESWDWLFHGITNPISVWGY